MPEHTPEHDALTEQLTGLAADSAHAARLASATDIRRRAGRRRAGQVAVVAAATAIVLGVGWSVAAPGSDHAGNDLEPVAPPSPTSATTTPAPDRTSVPPDEGETAQEFHPQFPALPAAARPGPTPPGGWVTTLPDDLKLPFEGVKATSSEASDWETLRGVDSWLLTPCDATQKSGYASDDARTDLRSIGYHAIEQVESEQLGLYADDHGAIAAMDEFRRSITQCAAERTVDEKASTYNDSYWGWTDADQLTVAGLGHPDAQASDESLVAWNWNRTYDLSGRPQYGLGGGFFVVTRVGNAIFVTMRDGETNYGDQRQVQQSAVELTKTTRGFVPTLCSTFADADGCTT